MKKILFITTSNLDSANFTGDTQRANNIINFLRIKNIVDVISLGEKKLIKKKVNNNFHYNFSFKKNNFFFQIFFCIKSLFYLEPIQFGFFFSKELKNFVKNNHKNYNTIICHLNRSSQYLPKNFKGNKILEMTDLESNNYNQRIMYLKKYNPLYFLYLLEKILIKKFEKKCINLFDKIVLVSRKDLSKNSKFLLKKTKIITMGTDIKKNLYNANQNNNKIIFIGNINYLPNKDACLYFSKKILPILNKSNCTFKLIVIGKINILNKISFMFQKNIKFMGPVKNLDKYIKQCSCAISNLRIATGVQTKILTYGSYGLPVICSSKSINGLPLYRNNFEILVYKNDIDFINKIKTINYNIHISKKISKKIYNVTKTMTWNNVLREYHKII